MRYTRAGRHQVARARLWLVPLDDREERAGEELVIPPVPLAARRWFRVLVLVAAVAAGAGLGVVIWLAGR